MLCPIPLFPDCRKPVPVAIRTVNGKSGEHVVLDAGDVPLDASDMSHTVTDEFRDIRGALGSAGSLRKVEDYLYEADFTHLDAAGAETHFRERFVDGATPAPSGFGCSVIRLGDLVGRAYDWKYDEAVTFVVRTPSDGTRFASVAICSSPAGVTRQAVESLSVPGSVWPVLPFYATDGMNEHGVTCSVCVVRAKGDESVLWHGRKFCAVGAVRQVLDRARTAQEGADIIASEAWMPAPDKLGGYSLHFMITDASHTFVVEDGIVTDITDDDDVKAMTNFRLGSRSFLDDAGHADVNIIASYDPFGTGVERYNELVDYVKSAHGNVGMREWLTGFVYSDAYGESLLTRSTTRPSDFAGTEISRDHFAKVNETEAIRAWFVSARIHEKWLGRARDGKFWHTVHSAVYDTWARTVSVVVQEGLVVHEFPLVRSGGGEGTVKSVNGVRPDWGTGDVALSAQDIPYGGEGASNVETAVEQNAQGIATNAEAIESLGEQLSDVKDTTYTKEEVDDKINQFSAHYLTADANGSAFATVDELTGAEEFYYAGELHTPDNNDYATVLDDGGKTARWSYFGEPGDGEWQRMFYINETALTPAQWAAVESGITEDLVPKVLTVDESTATKRIKLGSRIFTSFDELTALVQKGVTRLRYYVTNAASRPVLYTAHLCDASAIRFDATGTLGEAVYTRSVAITKSGDDGIAVTVGDLTELPRKNEVQPTFGSGANVATGKYKQIAIGAHATANGQNAIALGSSEPAKTNGPRAMAQNAVAIGAGANATAANAVQIFAGTNSRSGTIQLGNKTVAFLSDIPISQADIDDYRYYKGHWDMGVTYKTGDIVRAERTVEGEVEVVYFKSLRDGNRAQNPFTSTTYWTRTTDDEGLEKLTLFVKATIQQLTGADIPVSPTDTTKINESLAGKRDKTDRTFEREVGPGEFDLSEVERLHPLPARYTYKVQPYHFTDGKWYLEIATYDGSEEEDQIALSAESADSAADALAMESFTIGRVAPGLPESYSDLVGLRIERKPLTVEDTLALTSEIPDVSNLASKTDLAAKRGKADNICAKDEFGEWSIPAPIVIVGVTHSFENTQPEYNETEERWEWASDKQGGWVAYAGRSAAEATFINAELSDIYNFESSRALAKANESYVTKTGVENLIPKPTTTIAESSSGKAAEAAAVKTAITAATKLTPVFSKWSFSDGNAHTISTRHIADDYFWIVDNADDYFPKDISDEDALSITFDPTGLLDPLTATRSIVGYKLGSKTAGTDPTLNGMSVGDITMVAEASSQVNASTALALKDRDCCLVAFAANMTFTFAAKEEGKTGLRSFEVIVTGCVKDGAVNWPAVTYRGDSTDLIPEEGDNHWTFAEQQDGSFAVTRHVANTFTIGE